MYRMAANAGALDGAMQNANPFFVRLAARGWVWLLLCAVWGTNQLAFAQVYAGQRVRIIESNRSAINHFSIMGKVKFAQAYELPTRAPSLVDFIRFAGGLTKDASGGGQIRIIRAGRVTQQSFYNPRSIVKLMPGDLVIIDGKVGAGSIFRGGKNKQTVEKKVQLGLVGVLDYPVIMEVKSELATISWVARQLGQGPQFAAAAKAIVPRRFSNTTAEQLLVDGSVIVFNKQLIDKTRLPELPRPFKAGKDKHPVFRDEPQEPVAAKQPPRTNATGGGAAPRPVLQQRHPAVAANPPNSRATPPNNKVNNQPGHSTIAVAPLLTNSNEEQAVRKMLTDSRSVQLDPDEYVLPSRIVRRNADGQPDILNRDQQQANQKAEPPPPPYPPRPPSHPPSPQAVKPFRSVLNSNEPSQDKGSGRKNVPSETGVDNNNGADEVGLELTPIVELPIRDQEPKNSSPGFPLPIRSSQPTRPGPIDSKLATARATETNQTQTKSNVSQKIQDDVRTIQQNQQAVITPKASDEVSSNADIDAAAKSGNGFFAKQGGGFADKRTDNARPNNTRPANNGAAEPRITEPTPRPTQVQQQPVPRNRVALTGPIVVESLPRTELAPVVRQPVVADSAVQYRRADINPIQPQPQNTAQKSGSEILTKAETPTDIPVLIISTIGGVGLFVAFCLLLTMMRPSQTPEPQPNVGGSEENYLDRMINNEMEIVEEAPNQAPVLQLFGKPTPEPILRVDNSHTKIRRPHFLDRGDQRGVSDGQPSQPDLPQPDSIDPDSGQSDTNPIVPYHPDFVPNRSPAVPARPAAATASATATRSTVQPTAASESDSSKLNAVEPATDAATENFETPTDGGDETANPAKTKRTFRFDHGHEPLKPAMSSHPKVVSVQPSPTLTQGSDILDRALASVGKGQS